MAGEILKNVLPQSPSVTLFSFSESEAPRAASRGRGGGGPIPGCWTMSLLIITYTGIRGSLPRPLLWALVGCHSSSKRWEPLFHHETVFPYITEVYMLQSSFWGIKILKASNMNKWGFPGGLVVKNLLVNTGDMGSIPEWGRSPGEVASHSSILVGRIPWIEEPGGL